MIFDELGARCLKHRILWWLLNVRCLLFFPSHEAAFVDVVVHNGLVSVLDMLVTDLLLVTDLHIRLQVRWVDGTLRVSDQFTQRDLDVCWLILLARAVIVFY